MPQPTGPESDSITLDNVFSRLRHWRNNKNQYDAHGIPEDIWHSTFQLEQKNYSGPELRRLLGLNKEQYNKKYAELYPQVDKDSQSIKCETLKDSGTIKETNSPLFAKAVVGEERQMEQTSYVPPLTEAAKQTRKAVKLLKSTDNQPDQYLDNTTVIIECIRPDGYQLKIHATSHHLNTIMQRFFSQEVVET